MAMAAAGPGRLTCSKGVGACRRQAEPAPTPPPAGRSSWMGSPQTLDPTLSRQPDTDRDPAAERAELLEHLGAPAAFGGHEFGDWPSTRSPTASAATWTPATATTTPA